MNRRYGGVAVALTCLAQWRRKFLEEADELNFIARDPRLRASPQEVDEFVAKVAKPSRVLLKGIDNIFVGIHPDQPRELVPELGPLDFI
ncbi:hypothetical protein FOBRF1_013443 [Fusarium oxysporum]